MNSSMIQRQLKLNAHMLELLYDEKHLHRKYRKQYNQQADEVVTQDAQNPYREQADVYTPFINNLSKRIKALEQLHKALKRDLQEAYTIEQFEKEWEALQPVGNEESFLMGRVRMAAEDGFVEPGVVAEIVEVE